MPKQSASTAEESNLNDLWEEHLRTEFNAHSTAEAVATMTANARVHAVPVMLGDDGNQAVHEFLRQSFLAPDSARYGDGPGVTDHWSGAPGGRDDLPVYPHDFKGVDTARHSTDREANRGSISLGHSVRGATSWHTSTRIGTRRPCWCSSAFYSEGIFLSLE
jgi:hypothetical protein